MGDTIYYSAMREAVRRAVYMASAEVSRRDLEGRAPAMIADQAIAVFLQALPAAGLAIVPKEPTEEMRMMASTYLGFDPDERRGQGEAVRISMWSAMIRLAENELKRPA